MEWQPTRGGSPAPALIAVAEDDDDLRELLCDLLRHDGHRVLEFEDGFELLDYVNFTREREVAPKVPDLVLTDVRMPGANGLDVVGWGRLVGMACPIIVLTAFPGPEVTQRAGYVGGVRVLAKPIEPKVLLAEVRAALGEART